MTRFSLDDEDVVVVIGTGAGGGTTAYDLTRAGVKVVSLEAGPYIQAPDFSNDEWTMFDRTVWLDRRTTSGDWEVSSSRPGLPIVTSKAVGGTTIRWTGVTPRFKAHEFKALSTYGHVDGADLLDWPISLSDVEPYYDRAERRMGVSHRHGRPPLPANNNYKVFANGAHRIGYRHYSTGPYATNAEEYDGRPASTQDGHNFEGDKRGSKWSTLAREIPRALSTGLLDLRSECQAVRIDTDRNGRADAVVYLDRFGRAHRQRLRAVVIAGNAVETARLLLMSSSAQHPHGLANGSLHVGRNYMRHAAGAVWGQFDQAIHMWRGENMAGCIQDESIHQPSRGFVGGYYLELLGMGLSHFANDVIPNTWGVERARVIDEFENTAGLWVVGEDMPQYSNGVTLNHQVLDERGLPSPNVHVDQHPNDVALREHGQDRARALFEAVGAHRVVKTPQAPSAHNMGTTRMSSRPEDGVVDRFGQTHEVENVFVADGSVFTTGAAANPTLTIVALAIRQAEHIVNRLSRGEL